MGDIPRQPAHCGVCHHPVVTTPADQDKRLVCAVCLKQRGLSACLAGLPPANGRPVTICQRTVKEQAA